MGAKSIKSDPDQLTIGELLSRLKVAQAWGFAVIIFGLVTGAFVMGYKLQDMLALSMQRQVTMSEMKHEFFTRYNRYITARDLREAEPTPSTTQDFELAKKMFVDLVSGWWTKQHTFEGDLTLRPEIIRKGFDPTKSRIIFADQAEFVIPPEIKEEVLQLETR